jgi:hypothetical protein
VVLGTFSPARAWRPALAARLARTLDITQGAAVSGLLRNLIAFVISLFAYGSKAVEDVMEVKFLVTPFDGGVRVLKSDKYLQLSYAQKLWMSS